MFVSIAQIECLLTPRLSEEFKWGFFSNWRGGAGRNIEGDLAQEISNRCSKWDLTKPSLPLAKSAKQPLASNKSHNNLIHPLAYTRHQCSTPPGTVLKMRRKCWLISSSWTPLIMNLQDPMIAFQISKRCPLRYLNVVDFHQWLDKHKRELSS